MDLIFVTGPALSGKTAHILSELLRQHQRDPFSYLFVGPTGDYVRSIREDFLRKASCIFSDRFLPLDQFAVRTYKSVFREAIHIGSHVSTTIICEILRNMRREDLALSSYMIDYLEEMIRDVKENGGSFFDIFSEEDEAVALLREVYEAFTAYTSDHMMFDTFDAYLSAEQTCKQIDEGAFGSKAFVDGFHDFSPAMTVFLENVLPKFDTVFLTCPQDPHRSELLSSSASIRSFVEKLSNKTRVQTVELTDVHYPKELHGFFTSLFSEKKKTQPASGVLIERFDNVYTEIDAACRKTKELVKSGTKPEDIALVAADFSRYSELVSSRLTEYGIPYRVEGDRPMIESFSVRALVLPLEIAASGFPPESFLALIEQGYCGVVDMQFFERIFSSARLMFGIPRSSLKHREEIFMKRIRNYEDLLKSKIEALRNSAEDDFDEETAKNYEDTLLLLGSVFRPSMKKLLGLLRPFDGTTRRSAEYFAQEIRENYEKLAFDERITAISSHLEDDSEKNAVSKLLEEVLPELSTLLRFMGKEKVTPAEYFSYLKVHLKNRNYKGSSSVGNRVEIQSLMSSRFSSKQIKIFLGFVEGSYPDVRINPLYASTQYGTQRPKDFLITKEKQQRLNLYLSLTRCTRAALITLPESTIDGLPLLQSPYLKEIQESGGSLSQTVEETASLRKKRLELPMSSLELKVSIAYLFGKTGQSDLFEDYGLPELKADIEEFAQPYSWRILDKTTLQKSVGKTFSFTRLKTYDDCPFKFFMDYILKLPSPEVVTVELSPMEEGAIFHSVLKDFYSGTTPSWEDALTTQLKRYLRHENQLVWEIEYNRLHNVIEDYITRRNSALPKNWPENLVPSFFEIPFGMAEDASIPIAGGLLLRGKVDRIDLNKSTGEMYIIDYKRGKSGDKKQLVLYAIAADHIFSQKEYKVAAGTFKPLTDKSNNAHSFYVEEGDEGSKVWRFLRQRITQKEMEEWLTSISEGIAEGKFAAHLGMPASKCYRCDRERICRAYQWLNDHIRFFRIPDHEPKPKQQELW